MPRKSQKIITWHNARRCWKKTYLGTTYYLATGGKCKSEDDERGYETALAEWFQIKRNINTQEYEPVRPAVLDIRLPMKQVSQANPALFMSMATDYSSDPSQLPTITTKTQNLSVSDAVSIYCEEYRRKAEHGEKAVSTYREQTDSLADFVGYCEKYNDHTQGLLGNVDATLLRAYRERQHQGITPGEFSPFTAKRRLRILKRFLEWAYRQELMHNLPRCLDRNFAAISLPEPEPHPFTKEQIQSLFRQSLTKTQFSRKNRRSALFLLLGLNCGYRSIDISTLEHDSINWDLLTISRRRNKTNSPQTHKLWKITADVLRDEMTDPAKEKLVLLSERGEPLVKENLDAKTRILDSVSRSFNRLKFAANIKGANTGHSCLRDTGATFLREHGYGREIRQIYLGHKTRSIEDHYSSDLLPPDSPCYAPLYAALDAMNDHFGLEKLLKT